MSIYTEEAERRAIRGRCEKCQRKAAPGHRTCGRHPADALSKSAPRVVAKCMDCARVHYGMFRDRTEEQAKKCLAAKHDVRYIERQKP